MTRNEYIKGEIEDRLYNLTKYVELEFINSINLEKSPSCLIEIESESLNVQDMEIKNKIQSGTVNFSITFVYKATSKQDTDLDLIQKGNEFIEFTELELSKIEFPLEFKYSYNSTDYYRIIYEGITNISNQRFNTYRDQLKDILVIKFDIDFTKINY